jgi:hypothetical protein
MAVTERRRDHRLLQRCPLIGPNSTYQARSRRSVCGTSRLVLADPDAPFITNTAAANNRSPAAPGCSCSPSTWELRSTARAGADRCGSLRSFTSWSPVPRRPGVLAGAMKTRGVRMQPKGFRVRRSVGRRHRTWLRLSACAVLIAIVSLIGTATGAQAADASAPSVTVTAPVAGATVSGTVTLAATASDNVGVTQTKWYVDGAEVGWDGSAPWQVSWNSASVANGQHSIFAKAADAAGNWGTSATVTFTVSNGSTGSAPTVTVTAPVAGATVSGTVTLAATASVGVTQTKWYVDGAEVGWDGSAPWQVSWNSASVANGQHSIFAKAADAAGNWGTSAPVTVAVSNGSTSSSRPCGVASSAPSAWDHVVWIVFENKQYSQIIGSTNAPYINSVASKCGLATGFYAEAHPSLPNYIAMTSGSTQGITDDNAPSSHPLNVASIFSQLGSGWRSLEESMPSNCYKSDSGTYAVRHNPAAYYTNLSSCSSLDVLLGSTPDISARFTFVTPNTCNDMHSCPTSSVTATEVKTGDSWLSTFLPKILNSSTYQVGRTAVFITWDEDDSGGNQHVPTLVIAPSVPAGARVATTFNHYSLLRTTEEMLGLSFLGSAASAASMRSGFHL